MKKRAFKALFFELRTMSKELRAKNRGGCLSVLTLNDGNIKICRDVSHDTIKINKVSLMRLFIWKLRGGNDKRCFFETPQG